jgi:hypothetical protein
VVLSRGKSRNGSGKKMERAYSLRAAEPQGEGMKRRLLEEAARLALRGLAPALALETTAAGVEERASPGAEPFLPLLRPLAREAWKGAREKGERPLKVEVLLDVGRGVWAVEVLSAPPPEIRRQTLSSPFAEEARRVLELMRMTRL